MKWLAVLALAGVMLAGCGDKDGSDVTAPEGPTGSSGDGGQDDQLHGWILDGALQPVVGARIAVHGENVTATTSKEGYYGFSGLDTDRLLTVQVEADGFKPQTRSVTLLPDTRTQVNFTMARVPVKEASMEKQTFNGRISCSALVRTQDSRHPYDCRIVPTEDNRVWEFNVKADTAGIVVEAFWDSSTDLASHLNLTVETFDLGIFDEVLGQNEGPSPLRVQVTQEQAQRFYRQGGAVRATIDVGRNIEDEETGVGAAVAFEQDVQLIASIFYVAPTPPGYTAAV